MTSFCIIETDDGLTIAERLPRVSPEETAERSGGTLVEAGPFSDYDEAHDALLTMESLDSEEDDSPVGQL